jgi:hypothetical protein
MLSKHEENTMAKLTDAQLIVLSAAAARDDGIAVVPAKLNKAAASKVGASLIARKLMRGHCHIKRFYYPVLTSEAKPNSIISNG